MAFPFIIDEEFTECPECGAKIAIAPWRFWMSANASK